MEGEPRGPSVPPQGSAEEHQEAPDVDAENRSVSPWSAERDVLDEEAITKLVATGAEPSQARAQVETATNRERFERAVARGVNAEDAASAVEGARLLQQIQEARALQDEQERRKPSLGLKERQW